VEIREYVRVLRRNLIALIALIGLGAAGGAAVAATQTPLYSATAEVYISTDVATSASDLSQGSTFTQQVVTSYAHIATTAYVLEPVRRDLRLGGTQGQLARRVSATAAPDTSVLTIAVKDAQPARAVAIANAVARRLGMVVDQLSPASSDGKALVKITQVQPASAGAAPTSPNWAITLGGGALIGLVLALVVAVGREALDTRIRDVASLEQREDLAPVIGGILVDGTASKRPLVVAERPLSIEAEAYRSVRTNLQFLDVDATSNAIVITSSMPGEGKSVTAANLALAIADTGERVLLIDADLRRPKVAEYFGIDGSVGLSDVLVGRVRLEDAVQTAGDGRVSILPSGVVPPNPSELLQSRAMAELIERLRDRYDTVLFDTPPLLPVSDAAILAKRTRGAILVTAMRRVRRHQLTAALGILGRVDAHVLGLLPTMTPRSRAQAYRYAYRGSATPVVAPSGAAALAGDRRS
jgi:capsular exopolysaccharide synthesis family protein